MNSLESLMTKDFKILNYLYDNRGVGNIIRVRQIDVSEKMELNRTTIVNSYKTLVELGYLDHEGDIYFFTELGLKVCKNYKNLEKESEIIMYCTKCGKPILDGWDFCKNCGNPVVIEKDNKNNENKINISMSKWKFGRELGDRKAMVIDIITPCNYLVSFIYAYSNYLRLVKNLNCKVLYIYSAKWAEKKYKDVGDENIVFARYSETEKIDSWLNQQLEFYFIIVEGFSQSEVYNGFVGKNTVNLYAATSISDIRKFDLPVNRTILPFAGTTNTIVIPRINNYGYTIQNGKTVETLPDMRMASYLVYCTKKMGKAEGAFIKLDKLLNL